MGGVDLNLVGRYSEFFRGAAREHRQNAFRPADGFSAVEHLHADCCALRRRCSGADAVLCRAIPRDGVCATDLSREPARYRSLLVASTLEALPHGLSRTGAAIDAGRCQRDARLAHLRGVHMDRGYVDFTRLYVLHQAGAFFVTRAKSNLDAHRVYSAPTDRATGIIADQTIALDGYATS